jgi:uncharacterized protein YneR
MNYKQIVSSNIEAYTQEITEAIAEGWEVQYGEKAPMQIGFSFTAWLEKPKVEEISVEETTDAVVRKAGRPPKIKE